MAPDDTRVNWAALIFWTAYLVLVVVFIIMLVRALR